MIIIEKVFKPASVKKEIGKNVIKARRSLGMSVEDLAEKMQMTPGYVGLIEMGRRSFTVVQMITLADILDVTYDELLPYAGNRNQPAITKVIKSLRRMTGAEISQVTDLFDNFLKDRQVNI